MDSHRRQRDSVCGIRASIRRESGGRGIRKGSHALAHNTHQRQRTVSAWHNRTRDGAVAKLARLLAVVWPLLWAGNAFAANCDLLAGTASRIAPSAHDHDAGASSDDSHADDHHDRVNGHPETGNPCCCPELSVANHGLGTPATTSGATSGGTQLPALSSRPFLVRWSVSARLVGTVFRPPPYGTPLLFLLFGRFLK